jgi:hypothetical protein
MIFRNKKQNEWFQNNCLRLIRITDKQFLHNYNISKMILSEHSLSIRKD